jgi:DNA-binding protein
MSINQQIFDKIKEEMLKEILEKKGIIDIEKYLKNYIWRLDAVELTKKYHCSLDEAILKARGRAISTAVDTAEITRNRFIKDAKVKDIIISTESITNEEGRASNVSSIEIILTKKG